ncbi:NHL repeat containing protein [Oopsacas minuta]|uniref:NHL repeat containing protein n=1 Tax=Oopsacas minuta TaxID=111878 RepID=A0AAV7K972_9METZ|nr:NHL repeat containing protein [Oopsacas minuta]
MATAEPVAMGEDNFVVELNGVRDKIITKFSELIECLKAREDNLLKELDNIITLYGVYKDKLLRVKTKKEDLNRVGNFLEGSFHSSVKLMNDKYLKEIDLKLKSIEIPIEPSMVKFVCENNSLLAEINKFGQLVDKLNPVSACQSKIPSLVDVSENEKRIELFNPCGLTIDLKTGNIYVADYFHHYVRVFDSNGQHLFKFGDEGEGKMEYPRSVTSSGDRIFISQGTGLSHEGSDGILLYKLDGEFVCRIGTRGKGELEFNCPHGLAIDEASMDIYISDYNNNRIQILTKVFTFKSQFGSEALSCPHDIKLTRDYISVLDESDPCLHLFNYEYILIKSVVSLGIQFIPYYFCIDNFNNILLSDPNSNSVHIFSPQFEFIHKITVSNSPTGISVDNQSNLVVVYQADLSCRILFLKYL